MYVIVSLALALVSFQLGTKFSPRTKITPYSTIVSLALDRCCKRHNESAEMYIKEILEERL